MLSLWSTQAPITRRISVLVFSLHDATENSRTRRFHRKSATGLLSAVCQRSHPGSDRLPRACIAAADGVLNNSPSSVSICPSAWTMAECSCPSRWIVKTSADFSSPADRRSAMVSLRFRGLEDLRTGSSTTATFGSSESISASSRLAAALSGAIPLSAPAITRSAPPSGYLWI